MDFRDHDPDAQALLLVQQFLEEQGYTTALKEVERQCNGLVYVAEKLPRGSMLLEMVYQRMEQQAAAEADDDDSGERDAREAEEMTLLKGGAPQCSVDHIACVDNLHAANIISVFCWPGKPQLFTGSGNGEVKMITFSGDLMWTAKLSGGGVLCLDMRASCREGGPLLLAGSMDGTVAVLDAEEGTVLAKSKPHAKYCIRVAWAPSILHVFSASWDSSLVVQRWDPGSATVLGCLTEVHREVYLSAVMDAVFLEDGETVVVALRNNNYLRLFSLAKLEQMGKVNMNATGDDHVSFTASHLALSPCGRYILISTDGARIIMMAVSGWRQVRNFFGLPIEKFHQPSTVWHQNGHYFYAAAAHGQLYVFHVGSTKVAAIMKDHEKNVRAIAYDNLQHCLVTAGFDRKVQIYKHPEG